MELLCHSCYMSALNGGVDLSNTLELEESLDMERYCAIDGDLG